MDTAAIRVPLSVSRAASSDEPTSSGAMSSVQMPKSRQASRTRPGMSLTEERCAC